MFKPTLDPQTLADVTGLATSGEKARQTRQNDQPSDVVMPRSFLGLLREDGCRDSRKAGGSNWNPHQLDSPVGL